MTTIPDWLRRLFAAIDARDADAFAAHLADDVLFRFGNNPPVHGRDAVRELVASFFQALGGLSHRLLGAWEVGDTAICRGEVTYTRLDGSTLTVPFANVFTMRDGQASEYLIHIDNSELFKAPAAA